MRRIQLTSALIEQIALDVRAGSFIEPAARRHGVGHSTLHKWLARGRELMGKLEAREVSEQPMGTDDPDALWTERIGCAWTSWTL